MKSKFPQSQIYLIHGNNETEVSNARYELVTELLGPEERDTGLTEIQGPGNQQLTLNRAISEIIGELGTSSFIAGSRRVVVVYDLKELYGSSGARKKKTTTKKKSTPAPEGREKALTDWLDEVLPTTENVVIFVCRESDEKQRLVSAHSQLYRFIKSKGAIIEKRERPLQFEFENHLLAFNATAAIALFREWVKRSGADSTARLKMYTTFANFVELLFQARCIQEAKDRRIAESQVKVLSGFPALGNIPDWKAKKIHNAAASVSPVSPSPATSRS